MARHFRVAVLFAALGNNVTRLGGHSQSVTAVLCQAEQWTAPSVGGVVPLRRSFHSAVLDSSGVLMVVFGGYIGSSSYRNDVGIYNTISRTWQTFSAPSPAPSPRQGHTAVRAPGNNTMVSFLPVGSHSLACEVRVWRLRRHLAWRPLDV